MSSKKFGTLLKRAYKQVEKLEDVDSKFYKVPSGHWQGIITYGQKTKKLTHSATPKNPNNAYKNSVKDILDALSYLGVEDPPHFKMMNFKSIAHYEEYEAEHRKHQQKIIKEISDFAETLDDILSDDWQISGDEENDDDELIYSSKADQEK